jgi:hypothetical protein
LLLNGRGSGLRERSGGKCRGRKKKNERRKGELDSLHLLDTRKIAP